MSPQVLSSVVRITTHPRIFTRPSRPEQALDFCESILHQPNATVIEPGPRHWAIFRELCVGAQAGGNLVQDAWLAALAIESGCEWITTDRDFARFPGSAGVGRNWVELRQAPTTSRSSITTRVKRS